MSVRTDEGETRCLLSETGSKRKKRKETMIWRIAKKEFHNNLLTFRFTFGTLILILLILAIALGSIRGFLNLNQEYRLASQANEDQLRENRVYCSVEYDVIKPPEVLSILNLGVTNRLGNSLKVSLRQIPSPQKSYIQENPLLRIFTSLDLTLVYKIVVSLLAMLFAFDAVSGEKQSGTLKLLIAQGASRFKIILGKYVGNMLTLLVSFLVSLFIAFLIIVLHFPNLSRLDWLRIFSFAVLTLFYISVFFLLGLVISSLTRNASHSLIFCLFIWIVFVIIVPNLSTYLATVLKSVPLEKTVDVQIQELYAQTGERMREWDEANRSSISIWGSIDSREGIYIFQRADQATVDYFKKRILFEEPLLKERTDAIWEVKQQYYLRLRDQEKLATQLSRLSPTGLFQEAAEVIGRTDISNYERYIQQAVLYRESVYSYLQAKDAFRSLRFFTVMEEKDILPREEYRKVEYRKADGSYYTLEDYPPLNLEDFPRFRYIEEQFPEILTRVALLLVIFVILNVVLFISSAWTFTFYDVR
jgi:ABC-type transport system involved in multi-copper enzyme maturation permease subunit